MATRTDVTAAANQGFKAERGYGYCHCVQLTFGSTIRAVPSSNPEVPDTAIQWTARGNVQRLQIWSSVDEGATWQQVMSSGDPIPMTDGKGGSIPMPVGTVVTNRQVWLRQVFLGGADVYLDSISVTAAMESGEVVSRTESGNGTYGLDKGALFASVYDAGQSALRPKPDVYVRTYGDRGGLVYSGDAHDSDGNPINLHLSHGATTFGGPPGVVAVEAQKDYAARYTDASMAGELWIYPFDTKGTVLGWSSFQGTSNRERLGFRIYLEETTAGLASKLSVDVVELVSLLKQDNQLDPNSWTTEVFQYDLHSGDDAIPVLQWSHVAWSYDGFWLSIYINGVLVARRALISQWNYATETRQVNGRPKKIRLKIGIPIPTDGRFVMGRHPIDDHNRGPNGADESFDGYYSELRLYHKPLSVGQIVRRMRRRITNAIEIAAMVADEGLRALLPLNDVFGTGDLTGNNIRPLFNQQVTETGPTTLQVGWVADREVYWSGFPTGFRNQDPVSFSPGRQSPPLSIDVEGDVLRLTNHDANVTFPDDRVFVGIGNIGEIKMIQEPADLLPTGAELTLNGISQQHISLAQHAEYIDRPADIFLALFDEDGALVEDPISVFSGRQDKLDIQMQADQGICQMAAESHLRRWSTPGHSRWNHQAQLSLYGDDYGLQFLAEMVDKEVWWPARLKDANSTPGESDSA